MTKLQELMERRGLTVRQLSDRTGIIERTVYRHVKGETTMDINQAAIYAHALEVEIKDLLENAA